MDGIKISIENLNLYFGKQHVLKNIDAQIPTNKITVIMGPSGCGKTTLMKSLNRLTDLNPEAHVSGTIRIDNEDILQTKDDITLIRKKMGLLAQRPYPLPMSIYNNIAYGLRISGRRKKKILDRRVEHYLRQVSLWDEVKDRLKEPAGRLSIGQQQRLCLARGLAVGPEIILADEPTSALDPISSQAIEAQFNILKKNYTIVLVTHILRQARRLADHVIFMYLGEVIEQGPATQVFENPQQEMTKSYLKGMFY
ncbi:MAG: phosphate ABC transporter ATP-binding protein [Bacteroidales bacterium]|jgi:phosphate transport system ATP-binding protein|nr:phosphate ABC transporter ATP-binding protein [Bacteroidales bacterium]NCU35685.1 phosphate ABC transporter ATP-binding protein [Candidatus Falkowbacteria bacterium]MDD3526728.1 phosphate ABC transporter ATP-binding protein [Bacteroidales bacterium]MDD4177229.1 phosphate ABC transporter ATP-binding protein [Bacteroidales bacterium]MDD4741381.1 phosphate ABC transporter ATP-binding protein [Bacteroidales bacterium]